MDGDWLSDREFDPGSVWTKSTYKVAEGQVHLKLSKNGLELTIGPEIAKRRRVDMKLKQIL